MRVLNLCETARGGVGVYQRHIAQLGARGIEMHHVVPAQHSDFLGDDLQIHTFDRPERGRRAVSAMLREFRVQMRAVRPNLCFFHSSFSLAALAEHRMRGVATPSLYCPHGWAVASYPEGSAKLRIVKGIEGRLSGLADRVVCVSRHEAALARAHGYRGRFEVIENAVPDARSGARDDLFAAEPDALHLLFVGRLDRQKGFDILAQAMRSAARPDIRLHVVGGAVRDGGGEMALPDGIDLAGWVGADTIDDWYRSADALIVPSRWEGLPLVIPEALRNGTPVLCSERSGMTDLIEEGSTGHSFTLEVAHMADTLKALDKTALRAMRPACRASYEKRFSLPRLLDDLELLIREVAQRDG